MKQMPKWKNEIDSIHAKHLNYIQPDGVHGLAFHYTSPSGLLGIISNGSIWFSDSDYLNDASESDYFLYLASQIFSSVQESKKAANFAFRSYFMSLLHSNDRNHGRETLSREKERRYIFSLSVDSDALSLWNYYTKTTDSTGYNIGFQLDRLTNSLDLYQNQTLLLGRVIYSRDYQNELLRELYNDYFSIYEQYSHSYQRKYLYAALEDNITKYSIFMKEPSFSSESEFRVAIFEKGAPQGTKSYREKNGAFLPYITKNYDLNSISSIMISPTTKVDFVKRSITDLCDSYGLQDIAINHSEIPVRY